VRGFLTRIGLAVAAPRWAFAVADQPAASGRSGTDLMKMLGVLVIAAHARAVVAAVWLGVVVGVLAGLRGAVTVLSQALNIDLAFLVIATLAIWAAGGPRRSWGRAFDAACVAALPLIAIELAATLVVRIADAPVPRWLAIAISGIGFAWAGSLVALALRQVRRAPTPDATPLPADTARRGLVAGAALAAVAVATLAVNTAWIVANRDLLRPMTPGDPAPEIVLPAIDRDGKPVGPPVALSASRGKIVVIDFWATWCDPCVRALPMLDRIARELGPRGVEVLAINLDDPGEARKLAGADAALRLLYDNAGAAERYGVGPLPHTVIVDRDHRVRVVHRGGSDVRAEVERLLAAPAP
jgi:thiol-disulfide isomerase/thioredoxin